MTRSIRLLAALTALILAVTLAGCKQETAPGDTTPNRVSSSELVERAGAADGDAVEFTGEAIGEAMVRGDDAWLHLNDDAYFRRNVEEGSGLHGFNSGMPVFLSSELADQVEVFGDYTHQGDIVTVRGTFNAACGEHGGDTDIHADSLTRETPGHRVFDEPARWKIALAAGLSALVLALWQFDRRLPPVWEREQTEGRYRAVRIRTR
ncbi:MAG: hypothetical protein ACYC6C_00625 [Coriobacteriia bacterium]